MVETLSFDAYLDGVHSHEHPIDLNCFSAINLNLEDESDKEPTGKRIHDR